MNINDGKVVSENFSRLRTGQSPRHLRQRSQKALWAFKFLTFLSISILWAQHKTLYI